VTRDHILLQVIIIIIIRRRNRENYKIYNLTIEILRMWNVKAKMLPVIIWTTGTISRSLRQYLSNIPESMN